MPNDKSHNVLNRSKEYYLKLAQNCIRRGQLSRAIEAYNNALIVNPDYPEARSGLENAYNLYKIPGLHLIEKSEYNGNPKLLQNANFVLKGDRQLTELPNFGKYIGVDFNGFDIREKYPVLKNEPFAIDFSDCPNLKILPNNYFSYFENIVSADLSGCTGIYGIPYGFFNECLNLKSIKFPQNITYIDELAFASTNFREINLSHTNVQTIYTSAFLNNKNLEQIFLPDTMKFICDFAFAECYNLHTITLPQNIDVLSKTAFKNSGLTTIEIPENFLGNMGDVKNFLHENNKISVKDNRKFDLQQCIKDGIHNMTVDLPDKAIENFDAAILTDPNNVESYLNRGIAYASINKTGAALRDIDRAIELDPSCSQAYYATAIIFAREGNYSEAISQLTTAIQLNKNYTQAYYLRGSLYSETKQFDEAQNDFTKIISDAQQTGVSHFCSLAQLNRGKIELARLNYDSAINDLSSVIESANTDTAYAYLLRGIAYSAKGDINNSVKDFNNVTQLDSGVALAYFFIALSQYNTHDFHTVIDNPYNVFQIAPDIYSESGKISWEKYNFILNNLNNAIEINPLFSEAYFCRGKLYEEAGESDLSCRDFDNTVLINSYEGISDKDPDTEAARFERFTNFGDSFSLNILNSARQPVEYLFRLTPQILSSQDETEILFETSIELTGIDISEGANVGSEFSNQSLVIDFSQISNDNFLNFNPRHNSPNSHPEILLLSDFDIELHDAQSEHPSQSNGSHFEISDELWHNLRLPNESENQSPYNPSFDESQQQNTQNIHPINVFHEPNNSQSNAVNRQQSEKTNLNDLPGFNQFKKIVPRTSFQKHNGDTMFKK